MRCLGGHGFSAGYLSGYSAAVSRARRSARAGEVAILAFACAAIVYELTFDDLLSMATERWCRKHPILARIPFIAIFGHLTCLLPYQVDVFNAHNIIHRGIVWMLSQRGVRDERTAAAVH